MKLPLLSFRAMEEDDLWGDRGSDHTCHANERQEGSTYVFKPHILIVHLHIHLGVVDEVLQWVST